MPSRARFKPTLRQTIRSNTVALESLAHQFGVTQQGAEHIAAMREEVSAADAKAAARKPRTPYAGIPEAEIQKAIIRFLLQHPAVAMVERINSGAVYGDAGNFIRFHTLMLPKRYRHIRMRVVDLNVMLNDGRRMAIECKRDGWKSPMGDREREQAAYLAHVREAGGIGIFATCVEDVAVALLVGGYKP